MTEKEDLEKKINGVAGDDGPGKNENEEKPSLFKQVMRELP